MRLMVFDTEATDLTPGQLCQLSYLMVDGENIEGKNMFFTVDEMNEDAQAVHGFSREMLEELSHGERFEDRVEEIVHDFSSVQMWVGHNVRADDRYLRVEVERTGRKLPKIPTFCTMNYFTSDTALQRKIANGRLKPPKLEELAAFFNLEEAEIQAACATWFQGGTAKHDARFDTAMTYLCLREGARRGLIRGLL